MPNQHGAWAMLIAPAVLGLIAGVSARTTGASWAAMFSIVVAWFAGYGAFFAFGLWIKAKNPTRKASYRKPMLVYGAVAVAASVLALILRPGLIWWVLFFAPLVGIAVFETYNRRPRSLASGVSTTLASALIYPVLVMASAGKEVSVPWDLSATTWIATAFLAMYFTGTIPYVKTMIREKDSQGYLVFSIAYHFAALVATGALLAGPVSLWGGMLMMVSMLIALLRAFALPITARQGIRAWSVKEIGIMEMPIMLLVCLAVMMII